MPALKLTATAFTHTGAVRPGNEDTIAVADWIESAPMAAPRLFERTVSDAPVLCLVADGMGGHAAGEVSSRAAAEYLIGQSRRAVSEAAVAAIVREAHDEQFALMQERPTLLGMGTTVAGVAFTPTAAIVFNVGDSRVYRIDAGALTQLSTDDTPGPKGPDGRIALYTSNIITQTLGGNASPMDLHPHVLAEALAAGTAWLIASDGLTDLVEVAEIEALLGEDDRETVELLFEAAMKRGGRDNVSIILARMSPGGS